MGSAADTVTLTCPDWKDHFLRFAYYLWKENVLCDTQIKCRNDDTVNAHSIVLASCSPLLKKFFMKCRPGLYTVKMDTTSAVTWGYLLEFLYTGQLQLPNNQLLTFHDMVVKLKVKQAEELTSVLLKKAAEGLAASAAATNPTASLTQCGATTPPSLGTSASNITTPACPVPSMITPLEVKKEMFEERMETESSPSTGRLLGKVSMVPGQTSSSRLSTSTPESGIFSLAPEQEQTAQQEDAAAGDWHGQIKLHSVRSLCPHEGTTNMETEDEHNTTTPHDCRIEHNNSDPGPPDLTATYHDDSPMKTDASAGAEEAPILSEQTNTNTVLTAINPHETATSETANNLKNTSPNSQTTGPGKYSYNCINCTRVFSSSKGFMLHREQCYKALSARLKTKYNKRIKDCKVRLLRDNIVT